MITWNHLRNPQLDTAGTTTIGLEGSMDREQNFGLDSTFSFNLDKHQLKTGLRAVKTRLEAGLSTGNTYDLSRLTPGSIPPAITITEDYTPEEDDLAAGLFIEDDWKVLEKLDFVYGVRADYDNLRENTTKLLPRFAAVYQLNEKWTAKYLFNTGYARPSAEESGLGVEQYTIVVNPAPGYPNYYYTLGASKSENITANDVEVQYHTDKTDLSFTAFQTTLDNFFNYGGGGGPFLMNGIWYRLGTTNTNDITSTGLEIEGREKLNKQFDIYGNFSGLSSVKVNSMNTVVDGQNISLAGGDLVNNDGQMLAYPRVILNLGVNANLAGLIFNLNYRGWTDMWATYVTGQYVELGPQHFVDLNVLYKDAFKVNNLDLSVYAKNLLNNNNAATALPANGGSYTDIGGIATGVQASYKFAL
jgi:outer membrane receptor for ferrienterochelin and colicin